MVRPTTTKDRDNSSGIYSNNILYFARNATSTIGNGERSENILSILEQVIALVQQDECVEYSEDVDGIDGDSLEDEELEDVLLVPNPNYGGLGGRNGGGVVDDATGTNLTISSSSTEELLLQPSGVESHEGNRHHQGRDCASSTSAALSSPSLFNRYVSTESPSSSPHHTTTPPTTPTGRTASVSSTNTAISSMNVVVSNITNDGYIDSNDGRPTASLYEEEMNEEEDEG